MQGRVRLRDFAVIIEIAGSARSTRRGPPALPVEDDSDARGRSAADRSGPERGELRAERRDFAKTRASARPWCSTTAPCSFSIPPRDLRH